MEKLAVHLALNGAIVLTVSLVAGLLLYRSILKKSDVAAWHLVHAGGCGRGVMLIALAATVHLPAMPLWQLSTVVWLVIFFTWTSMLAMIIRAVSGERGLRCEGSVANKVVYICYAAGTVAIFPALLLLILGLLKAL